LTRIEALDWIAMGEDQFINAGEKESDRERESERARQREKDREGRRESANPLKHPRTPGWDPANLMARVIWGARCTRSWD
jgi:hypothetical protein